MAESTQPSSHLTWLDQISRYRLPLLLMGLAALVIFGLSVSRLGLLSTITTIFMFVILAEAWNILGGYAGYLNLGMSVFFGLGAYTTAILASNYGIPFYIAIVAAGLVAVLFAAIIGLPSLRLRGAYFTILTLIIGFLVQTLALNAKITKGAIGIFLPAVPLAPRATEQLFYFVYLVLMIVAVFVVYKIEYSKFGYALVAIREDEEAAAVLGVRTTWLKMMALLIGALMAGIVGGIFSYRISYIEPIGTFSLTLSINVVLMTVVGGSGRWQGPLIGVPLIMLIAEVLRINISRVELFGTSLPTEVNRVVFGLILVFVALYAQQGIMGLFRRVRSRRFSV
ncbi:MAG: branched-chain amino acid ABC transporter permease [Anaerolineae bacterium]|nr:branched-chain amino acid ABC transporter permease [Anaerolineae bacterium]